MLSLNIPDEPFILLFSKIRLLEHFFFLLLCDEHCFFGSKALLLSGRSNASLAEKRCQECENCCYLN